LPNDNQSQWDYLNSDITTDYLASLRASRAQLNHQIDMSRKTIATSRECLRKLDQMLEKSILKP